jgi:tRNA G37 N-methylase Trm5
VSHFRQAAQAAEDAVEMIYDAFLGSEDMERYHREHGTPSLLILTQHSPRIAAEMARLLDKEISGKTVVEIGAGVGFLAIEMAKRAKSVHAIEVDPAWSWVFMKNLYIHKPKNLTWIFGSAETVADWLRAEVAVIVTRSGEGCMRAVAERMAPRVVAPFSDKMLAPMDKLSHA